MSKAVRFSIITVALNDLDGLVRTERSLNWALLDLFEWIVIDGGSSDGTSAFVASLSHPNIHFISELDSGIYHAMNKGIVIAKGEYCIFMNSGDCFGYENVLSDVSDLIGDSCPTLVYGDSIELSGNRRLAKFARRPSMNFYSMFTHHQSIFFARKALATGYNLFYKFSADWALTTSILKRTDSTLLYVKLPICIFKRGGVSQREDERAVIDGEHWRICRFEMGMNKVSATCVWTVKRRINIFRSSFPRLYDFFRFREIP